MEPELIQLDISVATYSKLIQAQEDSMRIGSELRQLVTKRKHLLSDHDDLALDLDTSKVLEYVRKPKCFDTFTSITCNLDAYMCVCVCVCVSRSSAF
jgi:hypothetical protein